MKVEFFDTKRRKKLIEQLNSNFGITEVPRVLFETGKEKIRGFSGDLGIDELYSLDRIANVEFLGIYLFKEELGHMRLGFDGSILFRNQIVKNIVNLDSEQTSRWMAGHNIDLILEKGIYVVKYEDDVLGCGFSDGKHLINFVPKERRVRRGS